MLTFLSRSLRALRAGTGVRPAAPAADPDFATPRAAPESAALQAASELPPAASALPQRPPLRLVAAEDSVRANRDNPIAAARDAAHLAHPGAAAFVAGAGARLYSLDAFRAAREPIAPAPGPRPRRLGA